MEERLQKILAQAGFGSRRECEVLISTGRVTVNGMKAELGSKADPEKDQIRVDGQPVKAAEPPVYIALYKPRNVLSAVTADDPRPTVRDLVDLPGRLYPVGRLDVDSEGLILLTNDGELANRLTHPRYGHEKEYKVLVARRPDDEQIAAWRRGIVLEDGYRTAPAEVRVEAPYGKGSWLRIVLKEGRKRQIRETGRLLGLPVVKIVRVRIGSLLLGGLQPREWRRLTEDDIAALKGKKVSADAKTSQPLISPVRQKRNIPAGRQSSHRSGQGERPAAGRKAPDRRTPSHARDSDRPGQSGKGQKSQGRSVGRASGRSAPNRPARRPRRKE